MARDPYDLNDPVDTTKWVDMDPMQLQDQYHILSARLSYIQGMQSSLPQGTFIMMTSALDASMDLCQRLIEEKLLHSPSSTKLA